MEEKPADEESAAAAQTEVAAMRASADAAASQGLGSFEYVSAELAALTVASQEASLSFHPGSQPIERARDANRVLAKIQTDLKAENYEGSPVRSSAILVDCGERKQLQVPCLVKLVPGASEQDEPCLNMVVLPNERDPKHWKLVDDDSIRRVQDEWLKKIDPRLVFRRRLGRGGGMAGESERLKEHERNRGFRALCDLLNQKLSDNKGSWLIKDAHQVEYRAEEVLVAGGVLIFSHLLKEAIEPMVKGLRESMHAQTEERYEVTFKGIPMDRIRKGLMGIGKWPSGFDSYQTCTLKIYIRHRDLKSALTDIVELRFFIE